MWVDFTRISSTTTLENGLLNLPSHLSYHMDMPVAGCNIHYGYWRFIAVCVVLCYLGIFYCAED